MAKSKDWRRRDRAHAAEARKYEHPIPSRQFLLDFLEEQGVPMSADDIHRHLGLKKRDRDGLGNRLAAMVRDGQLLRNRRRDYCLVGHLPLILGRAIAHKDGFGFVVPDDGEGDDIYLSPREMREVIHGDRVAVRVRGHDRRGRPEGALAEVVKRNTTSVVGRYRVEGGIAYVEPDNPRITHQVLIPSGAAARARNGQIVTAEITEMPTHRTQPIGKVVEVLGTDHAPGMETEIAIRAHGLPHRWPAAVDEQMQDFGTRVPARAKKGRVDLRDVPLVTIDGADARDFDDAVFCEPEGNGWRLLVAIADVSHYVAVGTPLDVEAEERGTSVYFPTRVIPMLPEGLSNGLCSLNPKVDRLCMVCEMHVGPQGKVSKARFFEGLMRSHARLTYSQAAKILWGGDKRLSKRFSHVLQPLKNLDGVFRAFAKARRRRGAIDFDMPSVRFVFDERGRVSGVEKYERNDAHKIIEECMIAANVQAAAFLKRHRMPTLYRRHTGPDEDALEKLRGFLGPLGIQLKAGPTVKPAVYRDVLNQVSGRPDALMIETVLLRSMSQAEYHPENLGHFGLALPAYAHFTSPIRRYPDLLVHRGIRHVLRGGKAADFHYSKAEMEALGASCSAAERRADDATRDAMDWLKCEFMQDKIGDTFDGVVTGVTDFGLFVLLTECQVEGLVHVSSLGHDYYRHDRERHRLVGERTGRVYRLTDPMTVRVIRASLEDRKIDFEPVAGKKRSQKDDRSQKRDQKRDKKPGQGGRKNRDKQGKGGGRRTTRRKRR